MAMVLVLGTLIGGVAAVVFGGVAVVGYLGSRRDDAVFRRRWNARFLVALAVALVCLAPFMLGIKVG